MPLGQRLINVLRRIMYKPTKWMMPAAVSHTEMNIEISWASLIDVDVFKMLRYCKISGTVMSLTARRNRNPVKQKNGNNITPNLTNMFRYYFLIPYDVPTG